MKLFGRNWRVTIGDLTSSEIDIVFKVTRSLQSKPNTAEVSIYNLTADHRSVAQSARRPLVRIEAGYQDGMAMLFQGDARKVELERDNADWILKVTAGDGEYSLRTARAGRAFGPDTKLEQVIRYIADVMGIGVGNLAEALKGRTLDKVGNTFPAGTVVHGRAHKELDTLLRSAGLEWSVQDGVLQVLPQGGALARTAIVLNSGTGLVGSPERGKSKQVKAKALLIPDLAPGRKVKLESEIIHGVYRIEEAEYNGDTLGNDWYCDMTLREAA